MSDYAEDIDGPTNAQLNIVVTLAELQLQLEDQLAALERAVDETKTALRKVAETDLPEAMRETGIESYTLTGGKKVAIENKIVASPRKEAQPEMLQWLEQHDHADIIKHIVNVSFDRGEDDMAQQLVALIRQHYPKQKLDDKRTVHPMTLNAFVREQLRENRDLPEAFGVVTLTKSVIHRPKAESI
jgi:dihydroxyacetone kinase-like predicted kinase